MIQARFTGEAENAAQRYLALVESWRGIYARVSASPALASPAEISKAVAEAASVSALYMRNETQQIERIAQQIVEDAHQTSIDELESNATHELTDEALELLGETIVYLGDQLALQVTRDLQSFEQALRRISLEVKRAARSRGLAFRSALIEHRISNHSQIDFFHHDRASRKWASTKAVRAIWRHTLLSLYNEIVLSALADHSVTQATILHVNPSSQFHGLRISLHAAGEHPTYSEIRDEVFHPNSDAIVSAGAF